MVPSSTPAAAFAPFFIVHPISRETWDIAPLLDVMHLLGASNPTLMAESIYDISRYVTAEQYSSQDTAARLRLMVGRLEKLAVAFDTIQVQAIPAPPVVMHITTG